MAGDWLKMRVSLLDDPRVLRLAELLGEADPDLVIGKLFRLWAYADEHTTDGRISTMSIRTVNNLLGYPGFAQALEQVGWLETAPGCVVIPRFSEHNGESAKRRATENRRKQNWRDQQGQRDALRLKAGQGAGQVAPQEKRREEKIREEKSAPPQSPPAGGAGASGRGQAEPYFESDKLFAEFFAAYPAHRQIGRAAASVAWFELNVGADLFARVMARLERDKRSPRWREEQGRFVPKPAAWLRDRPWEAGEAPAPETPEERVARLRQEDARG